MRTKLTLDANRLIEWVEDNEYTDEQTGISVVATQDLIEFITLKAKGVRKS